jgi:hypothetical protein
MLVFTALVGGKVPLFHPLQAPAGSKEAPIGGKEAPFGGKVAPADGKAAPAGGKLLYRTLEDL